MQEAGVPIAGVMGTSAGALTGALYCAGYTPEQVVEELTRDRPLALLRPCLQPWKGGVLSLHKVVERLEELLPPTFDQLQREFAVLPGCYALGASARGGGVFLPCDVGWCVGCTTNV